MSNINSDDFREQLGRAFQPDGPISELGLFADPERIELMNEVVKTLRHRPQIVFVSGERGVGKTSFARTLRPFLRVAGWPEVETAFVSGDRVERFDTLFFKLLSDLRLKTLSENSTSPPIECDIPLSRGLPSPCSPGDVLRQLQSLPGRPGNELGSGHAVLVIDEIDRIVHRPVFESLAELAKGLTDEKMDTVVILVGFNETVLQLLRAHPSIARSYYHVHLERMTRTGVTDVLNKCISRVKQGNAQFDIKDMTKRAIAHLTQGLPHAAHLFGLHASEIAINDERTEVKRKDLAAACQKDLAGMAPRFRSIIRDNAATAEQRALLTACGLAATDDRGFLDLNSVRKALAWCLPASIVPDESLPSELLPFTQGELPVLSQSEGVGAERRFGFVEPLLKLHLIEAALANQNWSEREPIVADYVDDLDTPTIRFMVQRFDSIADLRAKLK